MGITGRSGQFHSFANSGMRGPTNPNTSKITSPGEMGGTSYSTKQNTAQMGGKTLSGAQTNISGVGKMPTNPTIKAGDFSPKAPKAPKAPTNPSMGKGVGMRPGGFQIGSGGGMLRID